MTTIAFIGLGNMGLPMAKNLAAKHLAAKHNVIGFDLSPQAKAALVEAGGEGGETLAKAVSGADVVVSMLPAGKHVESVYLADDGVLAHAAPDTLLIDSSTIDVDTARKVCAAAEAVGFTMVDAPVSGGVGGAAAGTLTFMVGGSAKGFAAAKPYLDIMGQNVFHAGAAGNGQVAKICNNMLLGISMIGTAEAFMLGEKLGLEVQTLFDISSTASGRCWSMTDYCPAPGPVPTSPANNDYKAGFTVAMMLKDLLLAQEASTGADTATPMGKRAAELYTQMADKGQAELDFSGIMKMLKGEF